MNLQFLPDVQRVNISAALGLPGGKAPVGLQFVSPAGWDFWIEVSQGASMNVYSYDVLYILDVLKFSSNCLCTSTDAHPKIVSSCAK